MSNEVNEYYAAVRWTVDDILTVRPEWSNEKAQQWLEDNQKYIQSRLIELGWEVIETLIDE